MADYRLILQKQNLLTKKRQSNEIPNTVLLVEHTPVITLGARKTANILLTSASILKMRNIDLVETRRGGGITAHNPGQLVFYPILNLRPLNLSATDYVKTLQTIASSLLAHFGLSASPRKGFPGLWVENRKIASIGVRVSKGITSHGMAINFNNDLSIFDLFIPCGIEGVKVTSFLAETGQTIALHEAKQYLSKLLAHHFSTEDNFTYELCN